MWKGFRQNHPCKSDECFCIVTFIHPVHRERVYCRLRGLPFGMGSVVNQFNRLPHLKTAVSRRLFGMLACHYFDDELFLDQLLHVRGSSTMIRALANLWGIKYSPLKSQRLSAWTGFLGQQYDWSGFSSTQSITFGIKQTTRDKASSMLGDALAQDRLTPGTASKIRAFCSGWITALQDAHAAARCLA